MRQKICTRIGKCLQMVETRAILRFEADEKYIVAHTATLSVCFEGTLKELEREFAAAFIRIHRGHLVRRELITNIRWDGYLASVAIRGRSERLPVSRARFAQVRSEIERLSVLSVLLAYLESLCESAASKVAQPVMGDARQPSAATQ